MAARQCRLDHSIEVCIGDAESLQKSVTLIHRDANRVQTAKTESGDTRPGDVADSLDILHALGLSFEQFGDFGHHLPGWSGSSREADYQGCIIQ